MWLMSRAWVEFVIVRIPAAGGRRLLQSASDEIPVEEFLDKHLAPGGEPPFRGVTSTRREVLSLYRDVWRATRAFNWPNDQGVPWKDVLRLSARREFEAAQFETDPELIARLVVMGRSAIRAALEKIAQKQEELVANSDPTRRGSEN